MNIRDKRFAVVIHTDSSVEIVETPGGADEIHRLVGGCFENVYPSTFKLFPIVASVDEEGKLKGKLINFLGTALYNNSSDFLVGDVVILKLERVGELQELDQLPMLLHEAVQLKSFLLGEIAWKLIEN